MYECVKISIQANECVYTINWVKRVFIFNVIISLCILKLNNIQFLNKEV